MNFVNPPAVIALAASVVIAVVVSTSSLPASLSKAKSNVVPLNSAPYLLDVNLISLAPTNLSAATSTASEAALTPAAVSFHL